MTDLYDEGAEPAAWVAGFSSGTGSQAKESDHLRLTAGGVIGAGQRAWVTDDPVDLTEATLVEVDWLNDGAAGGESYLVASTAKDSDHSVHDARLANTDAFARTVETLDVSALTGMHHVRVHARHTSSSESQVRTYRVTLIEPAEAEAETVGVGEAEAYAQPRAEAETVGVGEAEAHTRSQAAVETVGAGELLAVTIGELHTPPGYTAVYAPVYGVDAVAAADALAFHGARRELRFRFELLDTANAHLGWITGAVEHGARLSRNALADIHGTLQATVRDDGDINWLADRIRPWVDVRLGDGVWHSWPLGVYLPSTGARQGRGRGTILRPVDGYDLLQALRDDASADRTTYLEGATVTALIRAELEAAGMDDHNVAPSDETLPAAREWPPGTTRLRRINDLAGAIGYDAAHFGPAGRPVARPWRSPDERTPVWTYRDDDESVALPQVDQELDLFGVANRWVLVASEPDGPPLVAVRQNDDPTSSTSTVARGRVITDVREGQQATSQAALESRADRIASEASQVYEAVEMSTAIMPVHWHASVVELRWTELDISARYVEHRWDMTLAAGESMRHRVRRIVTIGGA